MFRESFDLSTPSGSPHTFGASHAPVSSDAPVSSGYRQADIDIALLLELGSAISRNVAPHDRLAPSSTGPSTPINFVAIATVQAPTALSLSDRAIAGVIGPSLPQPPLPPEPLQTQQLASSQAATLRPFTQGRVLGSAIGAAAIRCSCRSKLGSSSQVRFSLNPQYSAPIAVPLEASEHKIKETSYSGAAVTTAVTASGPQSEPCSYDVLQAISSMKTAYEPMNL